MRDRLDEFAPNTDVVVVTFTDSERLEGYLGRNDLPFPVVIDPDRIASSIRSRPSVDRPGVGCPSGVGLSSALRPGPVA